MLTLTRHPSTRGTAPACPGACRARTLKSQTRKNDFGRERDTDTPHTRHGATHVHATRTLHFMKTEKSNQTVSGRTFNLHVLYRRGYVRTRPRPAPPNCRSSIVSIAAASPSSGSSSSAIRSSAAASCPRPRCARASTNDETNSLTDQPATLLYFTAHSPARGRAPVGGRRRRAPEAQAPQPRQ